MADPTIPLLSEGQEVTLDMLNQIIKAANSTPLSVHADYSTPKSDQWKSEASSFAADGNSLRIEASSAVIPAAEWGIGVVQFKKAFAAAPVVIGCWGDTTNVRGPFMISLIAKDKFAFLGAVPNVPNVRVNYVALGI